MFYPTNDYGFAPNLKREMRGRISKNRRVRLEMPSIDLSGVKAMVARRTPKESTPTARKASLLAALNRQPIQEPPNTPNTCLLYTSPSPRDS